MKILLETSEIVRKKKAESDINSINFVKGIVVLVSVQEDNSVHFTKVFSHESDKHSSPIQALRYTMENFTELLQKGLAEK